jgi:hypothetical protein
MTTTKPMLYRCRLCRREEQHPYRYEPRHCPVDGALMLIDIGETSAMRQARGVRGSQDPLS